MTLYLGRVAAAGVAENDWLDYAAAHPEHAAELRILFTTPGVSGPAVMAANSITHDRVLRMQSALVRLKSSSAGRTALARARISSFDPAGSASYDNVWEFLWYYRKKFGRAPGLEGSR
jgi:ABC-type phosphate/phosphonate transport system substrate-binding protein